MSRLRIWPGFPNSSANPALCSWGNVGGYIHGQNSLIFLPTQSRNSSLQHYFTVKNRAYIKQDYYVVVWLSLLLASLYSTKTSQGYAPPTAFIESTFLCRKTRCNAPRFFALIFFIYFSSEICFFIRFFNSNRVKRWFLSVFHFS